jgi:hypothetical protein
VNRTFLATIIIVILVTGGLSSTVTYLIMSQRAAIAAAADAEKRAESAKDEEAKAQARIRAEVVHLVANLRAVWEPAPPNDTAVWVIAPPLTEIVRWLRKNSESMDDVDATGCPPDVQRALQRAAQAMREYSNYLEHTPNRRGEAVFSILMPLVVAVASEGTSELALLRAEASAGITAAKTAKRNQESGADELEQTRSALVQLHHALNRYRAPQ